ncbi:DUF4406 domain-containing protein [Clostridium sp. Marseille-P299]|uniref:DUF4406 domain-containing protein n=1 Tax=Clostridium sp. Marseille-P299 TaxID=1805477 RepID=UPI00082C1C00|nr:DUF4406 domain-containing protein [Clostridium sp. Marseille-P299]
MLIYISHPYGGMESNRISVENIITELSEKHPENTYISPIHCFGFMYDTVSYENGLEMCLNLLERCDKMLVFGDWKKSRGCTAEVLYAENLMLPYEVVGNF